MLAAGVPLVLVHQPLARWNGAPEDMILFALLAALGAVAAYTSIPLPWPVVFSALATVIASGYLTALWWLERQDER
jgi:hypothetical protein